MSSVLLLLQLYFVQLYPFWFSGYQTIVPSEKSGNVEVSAEVKGYREETLRTFSIRARKLSPQYEEENELHHSMDLQLVADVTVDPATVNVFNHPSAKVRNS